MADRTLTINHADGGSETYTINRDKFAGVREMSVDGDTVTVDHTAVPKEQSKETTFGGSQSITIKREIEPLLSEVVGGASAAYSLRDLNDKAGNNKVVRVRRASDNAEKDFKAKEVSNGTLVDWVGAGNDGFVEAWYDQSGNGNDATQSVAGSQPKIVDAGVLVSGGIDFDGVDDRLTCPSLYSSDISVFNVVTTSNTVNTNNYMRMIHLCDGSDSFQLTRGGRGDIGKLISKNTVFQSGTTSFLHGAINGENLISAVTSSTDTDAFVDGSLQSSISESIVGSGNNATTTIGARDDLLSSSFFAGSHAEIIVYPSDQSANREAIEANINNQYDIY